MRIAITGFRGQLGRILHHTLDSHELLGVDVPEYDIARPEFAANLAEMKADLVIHAAAMTDVDGCAKNPAEAFRINAFGTQNVALGCLRSGAEMLYISSNEVFDGRSETPYHEFSPTCAINPYGQTKLAGEQIASRLLARLYIVRISWLFSPGGRNFPAKILQLAADRGELSVVIDEISSPTYAPDLAKAIKALIETHHYGTYHLPNEGVCSRFEFAREILLQAGKQNIPIHSITHEAFSRPSTPPLYAPLANNCAAALGIRMRPWQEALGDYLKSL